MYQNSLKEKEKLLMIKYKTVDQQDPVKFRIVHCSLTYHCILDRYRFF